MDNKYQIVISSELTIFYVNDMKDMIREFENDVFKIANSYYKIHSKDFTTDNLLSIFPETHIDEHIFKIFRTI